MVYYIVSTIVSTFFYFSLFIYFRALHRGMNNPEYGTLCTYGYILMLLRYLQICDPPILLSLQTLPPDWDGKSYGKKDFIQMSRLMSSDNLPVGTYFYSKNDPRLSQYANDNKSTISELLLGFFDYYGNIFDYREDIISIRQLETIDKLYKVNTCNWVPGNTLGYI